jgi:hypothetical protein
MLTMALIFILAQVTAEALYYPLVHFYPFKRAFEGRALARVPLGFPVVDHHYRQGSISTSQRIADMVLRERGKNVLIITYTAYYSYVLRYRETDDVLPRERLPCGNNSLWKYKTMHNVFYLFRFREFRSTKELIRTAIGCLDTEDVFIHLAWKSRDHETDESGLYLTETEKHRILDE